MAARSRPLSPHLQIYKFTLTMASSVVHRGTGMAMYLGTLLIAIFGFWLVQVILFLATWALFFHMLGGIRYFTWDSVNLLDPIGREWVVRIQWIASILLTLAAWAVFVWFR